MVQGFGDPALIHTEPSKYTAVEVPGHSCPDPRTERYDPSTLSQRRAAVAAEIKAYDDVMVRDKELAKRVIRALAKAIHKRFKAQIATDVTTAEDWAASICKEYDAL